MSIRILLVEDDADDARRIREALAEADGVSYQLQHAMTLSDALPYLAEGGVDVILLDLELPDSAGMPTLGRMAAAAPDVPIVVLTAPGDPRAASDAPESDAQDCLAKDRLEGPLLVRSLLYAIERKGRQIEQQRAEVEMRLLRDLAFAIDQADDLESALALVVAGVCEATGWATGEAWLVDATGTLLVRGPFHVGHHQALRPFHEWAEGFSVSAGSGVIGRVWERKEAEWLGNVAGRIDFLRAELATQLGLRSALAVPVLSGEEVVAVVAFYDLEAREVDARMIDLVAAAAAQLGMLARRLRWEETVRQIDEEPALGATAMEDEDASSRTHSKT